MAKAATKPRSVGKKRRSRAYAMPKWQAYPIIGVILFLTGALLWMGQTIVSTTELVGNGRVDVTVERRFLGFIPLSTEIVLDVDKADVYIGWNRTSGGGKKARGSTYALDLTPRQGPLVRRTRFGPAYGTHPFEMADQINAFIAAPQATPLVQWWVPWVVNLAAIPFVLVSGAFLGAMLLNALGITRPETEAGEKPSNEKGV
jgi:hypothetical protein